jgi:hypothetical protein
MFIVEGKIAVRPRDIFNYAKIKYHKTLIAMLRIRLKRTKGNRPAMLRVQNRILKHKNALQFLEF